MTFHQTPLTQEEQNKYDRRHRLGRFLMGIIIVAIGKVFLLHKLGFEMPDWLLTDGALVAAIALAWGSKRLFYPGFWMLLLLFGLADMAETLNPSLDIWDFIWPCLIILAGITIMFKPRWHRRWHSHKHRCHQHSQYHHQHTGGQSAEYTGNDDLLESTSVFGGIKKNVLSKNFKGGEVTCVFGGADINLMQAEIADKAELEITMVFGGAKLLVPAHWEIKHEMTAILGGIEDKRPPMAGTGQGKVLVLRGTVIFGGVELSSY